MLNRGHKIQVQLLAGFLLAVNPDMRVRTVYGMEMVYIPIGEFNMGLGGFKWVRYTGSFKHGNHTLNVLPDQRPKHSVYLDGYWIDKTEVTLAIDGANISASLSGYTTGVFCLSHRPASN